MKNTVFTNQLIFFKKGTKTKHMLRLLLAVCFLFGAMPNAKATEPILGDDIIGQGFAFANVGKETSTAIMLSYVVTNTSDADPGSLRQAMLDAIAAGAGPHDITFDPALSGQTITLASNLPDLSTSGVTINGDINGDTIPDITIDGNVGDVARVIFRLDANSSNTVIKGFNIKNTGGDAFSVSGSPINVTIEDIVSSHDNGNVTNYVVLWNGAADGVTIRNITMTQHQNLVRGAIRFTGTAANVLIDGFTVSDSGGASTRGIEFQGAATDITIRNCDIDLDNAASTDGGDEGIIFSSTVTNLDIDDVDVSNYGFRVIRVIGAATNIIGLNHLSQRRNLI